MLIGLIGKIFWGGRRNLGFQFYSEYVRKYFFNVMYKVLSFSYRLIPLLCMKIIE